MDRLKMRPESDKRGCKKNGFAFSEKHPDRCLGWIPERNGIGSSNLEILNSSQNKRILYMHERAALQHDRGLIPKRFFDDSNLDG